DQFVQIDLCVFVDSEIQIAFAQLAFTDLVAGGVGRRIEQVERNLGRDRDFAQTPVAGGGDPGLNLSAQPDVLPGAGRAAIDQRRLLQLENILPRVQLARRVSSLVA